MLQPLAADQEGLLLVPTLQAADQVVVVIQKHPHSQVVQGHLGKVMLAERLYIIMLRM